MTNAYYNFNQYNPIHTEKLNELLRILTSSTYQFNCLEIDEKLSNFRDIRHNQRIPFENAFFQDVYYNSIDQELCGFLKDNGDFFFNSIAMQKFPDIVTLPPKGYSFLDLKLVTNTNPNTISINLYSYFFYLKISNRFDAVVPHMGIVLCGENDSNFKYFPISHIANNIINYTVWVHSHTPLEEVNYIKDIFGDTKVKVNKKLNNYNSQPYIVVNVNQDQIVDLHNYLFNLSEVYNQISSLIHQNNSSNFITNSNSNINQSQTFEQNQTYIQPKQDDFNQHVTNRFGQYEPTHFNQQANQGYGQYEPTHFNQQTNQGYGQYESTHFNQQANQGYGQYEPTHFNQQTNQGYGQYESTHFNQQANQGYGQPQYQAYEQNILNPNHLENPFFN